MPPGHREVLSLPRGQNCSVFSKQATSEPGKGSSKLAVKRMRHLPLRVLKNSKQATQKTTKKNIQEVWVPLTHPRKGAGPCATRLRLDISKGKPRGHRWLVEPECCLCPWHLLPPNSIAGVGGVGALLSALSH